MSILDRYIAREFWKGLIAGLITFIVLYLSGDAVRQGLKDDVPAAYVLQYTLYQIPEVVVLLLPAACLLGTMVCLSGFAKRNELTAMFASGVSLSRISFVILSLVFVLCCLSFVITDRVIPPLTKARTHFLRTVIQGKPDVSTDIKQNKVWYRSKNLIYNLRSFDPVKNEISGLSIYTFDDNFDLAQQVESKTAVFQKDHWLLKQGQLTLFDPDRKYPLTQQFQEQIFFLPETPADFRDIEKEVETLRLKMLWKYIQKTKQAGIDTHSFEVVFWSKISISLVPLIMSLLGIPFATQHHRKASLARDISLCFFIVVVYWLFFSTALSIGKSGKISPFWAAWVPNILFFVFGTVLITRGRKS